MTIRSIALAGGMLCVFTAATPGQPPPVAPRGISFQVKLAPAIGAKPATGRVLVGIAVAGQEPDFTNYRPPVLPILGADATDFTADQTITLDTKSEVFPANGLAVLPPGEYTVQAVFATNRDINLPFAPGNRYCRPIKIKLDPTGGTTVNLVLDRVTADAAPKETATHKYLNLPSKLLSEFHGRPMFFRVGVVLPKAFASEPNNRYGLIVDVGGFGTRYTDARAISPDPRFVQIVPDGAGPWGDPYQVDSANNGPYGEALINEVIPYIENTYRCIGTSKSRFTCGISTGGWVSLALQVFYPEYFNGSWSQCPDSVTFEHFELINIYKDKQAYVNRFGFDRPSTRTIDGDTVSTVRHECQLERVLGRGGNWHLGGRDWASWNAVYGPRGKDGLPVPIWDGKTGDIDRTVLDSWRKYDLLHVLEKNWAVVGPKLAGGKINIWVGDADEYFLNVAVRRLKQATAQFANPRFDGRITIEAGKGHIAGGWTRTERLDAMAARMR